MILAEFCLCLLTGIGLERIKPPEGRKLYWARLGTMAAAAIAIGAVITLLLFPQNKSTLFVVRLPLGSFWLPAGS